MSLDQVTLKTLDSVIGLWWLPENENNKIHGVLELKESRLRLRTTQMFEGLQTIEREMIPAVQGFIATGLKITLLDCKKPKQIINMPGMIEMMFEFSTIIVGKNYSSDRIQVKSLRCRFNGLEKWLGDMPVDAYKYKCKDDQEYEFYAHAREPEKYSCSIDDFTAVIESKIILSVNEHVEAGFKRTASVSFCFPDSVNVFDAIKQACKYRDFLTLCMGNYNHILSIQAVDEEEDNIAVLYNDEIKSLDLPTNPAYNCLISFSDIKDSYQDCVQTWYQKYEEIRPIIAYFVDACQKKNNIDLPMEFLKMVQALESYSRRMRKTTLIPPEEHQERISRIVNHFDEKDDDREWIADVLKTPILNEPSCSKRITALFKETAEELGISKSKAASLAYKIVATRNYYTHFNESLLPGILSEHDIFYSIALMKNVLKVVLCRELSVELPDMKEKLGNNSELALALGELGLTPPLKPCSVTIADKAKPDEMENSNGGTEPETNH